MNGAGQAVSAVPASVPSAVRLSDNERRVLLGMWEEQSAEFEEWVAGDEPYWFFGFKAIQAASGIEQHLVRRTVRALARKGLTGFRIGLWNDDRPAGAGYGLTRQGRDLAQAIETRRAETERLGAKHESAVGNADAPANPPNNNPTSTGEQS